MANLITLGRLVLLFVLVGLTYSHSLVAQIIAFFLLILIFIMDGLDGWVARRRGEASLFGSLFDIAADRVVENVLWVVLAHQHRVPIWVALVFLVRGLLVDSIRATGAAERQRPFDMARSTLSRFLIAGRFMRIFYAVVKAVAFSWLLLLPIIAHLVPGPWNAWRGVLETIAMGLILMAVSLCVARGLPVVVEFMQRIDWRPARRISPPP
jgi:CDP-diacylglycerol--glycerol-3-phosphate 3-phosphatidyltransferase